MQKGAAVEREEKDQGIVLREGIDAVTQKEFSRCIYCRLGMMKSCHGSGIRGWACSDAWLAGWLAGWRAKGTVVANGRTADWVELSHWGVGLESAIISEALGHYFMQKYEIFSFRFLTVVNGRKHVKDLSLGN